MLARAIAPTGALFTLLALVTGSLWGQPTWGTWWVWDARLTSELILLFLYLGFMGLVTPSTARAGRRGRGAAGPGGAVNAGHLLLGALVEHPAPGRQHQHDAAPRMAEQMLQALLLCTLALWAYAFAVVLRRAQAGILAREAGMAWVKELSQ